MYKVKSNTQKRQRFMSESKKVNTTGNFLQEIKPSQSSKNLKKTEIHIQACYNKERKKKQRPQKLFCSQENIEVHRKMK